MTQNYKNKLLKLDFFVFIILGFFKQLKFCLTNLLLSKYTTNDNDCFFSTKTKLKHDFLRKKISLVILILVLVKQTFKISTLLVF